MTNSLFIVPVSNSTLCKGLEKTAETYKLSHPDSWTHEITKYMYDKIPFVTKYPTDIVMDKEDHENGYASGNIIVKNTLLIPLLIKAEGVGSVMMPLDTFKYEDKYYPLSKQRVDEILFNPAMGTIEQGQNAPGAFANDYMDSTTPPGMDGVMSDDYRKMGSMSALDAVLPTTTQDQRDAVIKHLNAPEYISKFAENGTMHLLEKIATYKRKGKPLARELVNSGVEYTEITKTASGYRMSIYGYGDKEPMVEDVSAFTIRSTFGDETFAKVASEGFAFEFPQDRKSNMYILDDMHVKTASIKEPGSFTVYGKGGHKMTGSALVEVGFDSRETGRMIFCNGEKYAASKNMIGYEAPIYTGHLIKEAHDTSGEFYASFVFNDKHATTPVKIHGTLAKTAAGVEIQKCCGGSFVVTDDIVGIVKKGNKTFIPGTAKLVKMGKMVKLEERDEAIRKLNEAPSTNDKLASVRKFGNSYYIDDVEMTKQAAMSYFIKRGGEAKETKNMLNSITNEVTTVGNKNQSVNQKNHGVKGVRTTKLNSMLKNSFDQRMKIATIVPEDKSVDAVLAMGFINDVNVQIFRSFIPQFEEALSNLSGLLIAIRYGFKGVDETGVSNAIKMLDQVTSELKGVFATEDMVNNLSA